LYLPIAVCGLLDDFVGKLRYSITSVEIYFVQIEYPNANTIQERHEVMNEAINALSAKLPALRTELENEFRPLLGVT
jgi:hypothetical protein